LGEPLDSIFRVAGVISKAIILIITNHALKMYRGVEILLQTYLTSALDGAEEPVLFIP
jgi:hypothetical protein